jgi:hypothetical protein
MKKLETLLATLKSVAGPSFDGKLADYAFFPLSHIFRQSQLVPKALIELAVQCLTILLDTGWREALPPALGQQLLILITFIAGGPPGEKKSRSTTEESTQVALEALTSLFHSFRNSKEASASLATDANLPAVGHCITVILDAAVNGPSVKIQVSALDALDAFGESFPDVDSLVGFLPGIVSALTRILQTNQGSRRSYQVLVFGLDYLTKIVQAALSDYDLKKITSQSERQSSEKGQKQTRNTSWLKATSSQIKVALASVLKLRNHKRQEVREAVGRLCYCLLQDCRQSLEGSSGMLIETLVLLSTDSQICVSKLKHLASIDPSIIDGVKGSLHTMITALPRTMKSTDDALRSRIAKQISSSFSLLSDLGADSSLVDNALASNLRDSVVSAIFAPAKIKDVIEQTADGDPDMQLILQKDEIQQTPNFGSILVGHRSQKQSLEDLFILTQQVGGSSAALDITRNMLQSLHTLKGDGLLATIWLSLNLLRTSLSNKDGLEDFIISTHGSSRNAPILLDELYSFSLSQISTSSLSEQPDWRIQGLALEVIAFQAQQLKDDFRVDLVEALYPVIQLLGSPHPSLRQHAIIALTIITQSCGYRSASETIIANVDYLVNAIALKLNAFDISPQAPQVLLMMIKLSGPSLLPYLDDLVDSIFAALDNFHGYPRLVELLFSVLGAMVEEGTRFSTLRLESDKTINHHKLSFESPTTESLATRLLAKQRAREAAIKEGDGTHTAFPREPWNKLAISDTSPESSSPPPPLEETSITTTPTKTYILLNKILTQTQHHLSSPSTALQLSLLSLIATATPTLQRNEDVFLPTLNAIWPPILARLYDPSPFVSTSAAGAIAALCRGAGDFMSSRITEAWSGIQDLYSRTEAKMRAEKGAGRWGSARKLWEALCRLFEALAGHVRLEPELLLQMTEMVGRYLAARECVDLKRELEARNRGAVWFEMGRWGLLRHLPEMPHGKGFKTMDFY